MVKKYMAGVALIICLFLAACAEPGPAEILEEANQAQQELTSVEVEFEETDGGETVTGNAIFDFDNNVDYYRMNEPGFALYKSNDDFLIEYDDGIVADAIAETGADANEVESALDRQFRFMKGPLVFFGELNENLYEKFDWEEQEDYYVFTYNGEEADIDEIGRGFVEPSIDSLSNFLGSNIELSNIHIDNYVLEIIIDKETNLIQHVEQDISYSIEEHDFSQDESYVYTYTNYNETEEVALPAVTMEEDTAEDPDNSTDTDVPGQISISDEERETLETEAAAYLDALIQATVFQNAEEFINRAPDNYPEEEKVSEAEMQRDFFKEIYIQNTQQNMAGANVTEEEIIDLADAFIHALSTTEYEITGADAQSAENITVTVSVEGFSDTSVYLETEQELIALYEEGEIADDELDSKNLELLTEKYYDIDELLDPIEVEVHVMLDGAGTYTVLMQDQYLAGFVQ
ncbi:DUF6612 family protein [Virgibacillus kimchii]